MSTRSGHWHYMYVAPSTRAARGELKAQSQDSSEPRAELTLTVELPDTTLTFVKASLSDDEARALAGNSTLLPGSARLVWLAPDMVEDVRRDLLARETARAEASAEKRRLELERMTARLKQEIRRNAPARMRRPLYVRALSAASFALLGILASRRPVATTGNGS